MPSLILDIAGISVNGEENDNEKAGWAVLIRARSMVLHIQRGLCGVCAYDDQTAINATLHAAHFGTCIAHRIAFRSPSLVVVQRCHCPFVAQRTVWSGQKTHTTICDSIANTRKSIRKLGVSWTDIRVFPDEDTFHLTTVRLAEECARRIWDQRAYCTTCDTDVQATSEAIVNHYFQYHEGNANNT